MTTPADVYTAEEVRRVARQVLEEVPAPRVVEELILRLRGIHETMPERRPVVTEEHRKSAAARVRAWRKSG